MWYMGMQNASEQELFFSSIYPDLANRGEYRAVYHPIWNPYALVGNMDRDCSVEKFPLSVIKMFMA